MSISNTGFTKIKSGQKTIEIRLYDDKRKHIQVDDTLCFVSDEGRIYTRVIGLYIYDDFETLLTISNNYIDAGHESIGVGLQNLYDYYSQDEEQKYGVIGIKIQLLNESNI